jgi:hypothetical protein
MQTSFMHPPFGFALFYLRGISDTLFKNGALPKKVESNDIYLGSIPWVVMQLILVVVVIFFPATVTSFLDKEQVVDSNKAVQMLQEMDSGRSKEPEAPQPNAAPGSSPSSSGGQEAPDDGMEALKRAVQEDAAKGKK